MMRVVQYDAYGGGAAGLKVTHPAADPFPHFFFVRVILVESGGLFV
jgi:hypothetical protein